MIGGALYAYSDHGGAASESAFDDPLIEAQRRAHRRVVRGTGWVLAHPWVLGSAGACVAAEWHGSSGRFAALMGWLEQEVRAIKGSICRGMAYGPLPQCWGGVVALLF